MARSRLLVAFSVLALAGCVQTTSVDFQCGHGRCVRTDGFAFINRQNPVPGSSASQFALSQCQERIEAKVLALAEGHPETRWIAAPWIYQEGAALWCLVNPVCVFFVGLPANLGREQAWSREEAAARDQMAREIGQCMDDQGWLFCTWHADRAKVALDYSGPGWVCRRKHLDDPFPQD